MQGVELESQDIVGMTDAMARDMLATPILARRDPPPRVIVDSAFFTNESTQRINVDTITDRLRVGLNRAARGQLSFVARHYGNMVADERQRKRGGEVDEGSQGMVAAPAGGDYRLGGRITSRDMENQQRISSCYYQVVFEMVDLETGEIVWSGIYETKKTAANVIEYR